MQEEVRQLLCMVTRDNPEATESLCSLIMERISVTMRGHGTVDLGYSVRPEIALLAALIQKEDSCWELKLRSVHISHSHHHHHLSLGLFALF